MVGATRNYTGGLKVREELNKNKIKDWSPRKQMEYFGGYVKETVQQGNFRKRITAQDLVNKRKVAVKNTSDKLAKEGILNKVPDFMKDVVGLRVKRR